MESAEALKRNHVLTLILALYLLSPYLILVIYFALKGVSFTVPDNFWNVFQFTKSQALLSTAFSMLFGVTGAFGLLGLRGPLQKRNSLITIFTILPSAVPVLFVILAALNLAPSLGGLVGIVVVHTMINAGLVAVVFESLLRVNTGPYLELAQVEGASIGQILFKVIFPALKKEILVLAIAVFAFCFASFSVPLIIGGSQATTIEVLIYELVRNNSSWGQALFAAIFQTAIVLGLSIFIAKEQSLPALRKARLDFLGCKPLAFFALVPSVLLVVGLCSGVLNGFSQLFAEIPSSTLIELASNSLVISFGTAALCLLALVLFAFIQPSGNLRKFILGFVAPSSVLAGFALLILWRETGFASLLKIVIGLTFLFVPLLYRLGWDSKINSLRSQVQTASVLGASRTQIFFSVCWPQMSSTAAGLVALASFWAWGEFALSKIVAERTLSISLLIQSLMSSYRLNSATALVWLLFLGSGITYLIVWGLVNVTGRKSSY